MRSRNSRTANSKTSSKTYTKYDYELFREIMPKELFDYAVACNEYVERRDRMEDELRVMPELPEVS